MLFVESLDSPRMYWFKSADGILRLHSDCGDRFVMLDGDAEKMADETVKV